MSFSSEIKHNLIPLPVKGACCRHAFLFGALMGASMEEGRLSLSLSSEEEAAYLSKLILEVFNKTTDPECVTHAGRRLYLLHFEAGKARQYLTALEGDGETLVKLFGVKCPSCKSMFLRGAFIALGTVNDPKKSYHAECLLSSAARAEKLDAFLAEMGLPARRIVRGDRIGLYYKSGNDIEELFAAMNANTIVFDLANVKIERWLRNNENRATNCVTRNIGRSVDAAMKQVAAIIKLQDHGVLDTLPDELRETALLRLEHDNVSLSELAAAHTPPISKSGLNHRLEKIMMFSEKIK